MLSKEWALKSKHFFLNIQTVVVFNNLIVNLFSRCLIRIIASRCDIDLGSIKREYEKKFGRSLVTDISVILFVYSCFEIMINISSLLTGRYFW